MKLRMLAEEMVFRPHRGGRLNGQIVELTFELLQELRLPNIRATHLLLFPPGTPVYQSFSDTGNIRSLLAGSGSGNHNIRPLTELYYENGMMYQRLNYREVGLPVRQGGLHVQRNRQMIYFLTERGDLVEPYLQFIGG